MLLSYSVTSSHLVNDVSNVHLYSIHLRNVGTYVFKNCSTISEHITRFYVYLYSAGNNTGLSSSLLFTKWMDLKQARRDY